MVNCEIIALLVGYFIYLNKEIKYGSVVKTIAIKKDDYLSSFSITIELYYFAAARASNVVGHNLFFAKPSIRAALEI